LQLRHYEVADQLLRIEETKFNKSRLVPLAPSVALALERYLEQRRHCGIPTKPESVLMWCGRLPEPKAAYALPSFTDIWKRLCLSAGVVDERGRPPRVHDLRHSFAVEALHRWYEQGVNVQSRLPHLAAYLGHTGPSSSHYYLHLTPTLRSVASQRFYRAFGGFTTTGGTL
jgi:integrase